MFLQHRRGLRLLTTNQQVTMHVSVVLSVVTVVVEYVAATETTKEPSSDGSSTSKTLANNENVQTLDSWDSNSHVNSLWEYHPPSLSKASSNQPESGDDELTHRRMVFRPSQPVTRLAKSLSLGFDPYFNKGYFEPFERRPKPVTLIGFRKNGLMPRKTIYAAAVKSAESEVAELQSPFNSVSSFWLNEPGH